MVDVQGRAGQPFGVLVSPLAQHRRSKRRHRPPGLFVIFPVALQHPQQSLANVDFALRRAALLHFHGADGDLETVDAAQVILAGGKILAFRLQSGIVVIQLNSDQLPGADVNGFGVGIAVANDVQIGVELVDASLILRSERLGVDRP